MKNIRIILISFLFIFFINFISAELKEDVYITFEGKSAHVKQVLTIYALPGYYLPSFTYTEIFYPDYQKNIKINWQGKGDLKIKILENNESYLVYNITVPQIGETTTNNFLLEPLDSIKDFYYIIYEWDIDKAVVNYGENYEARVYLPSVPSDQKRFVYFCLPPEAAPPKVYDSRSRKMKESQERYKDLDFYINEDRLTEKIFKVFNNTTQENNLIIKYLIPHELNVSFCNNGSKKRIFPEPFTEYLEEVSFKWSIPSQKGNFVTFNSPKLRIAISKYYEENLNFLKEGERTFDLINNLGLKLPEKYNIFFAYSEDKIFDKKYAIVCDEDVNCYINNLVLLESNQIQLFNLIFSFILGSYVKTYREKIDSDFWFVSGFLNDLALNLMNNSGFNNSEILILLEKNFSKNHNQIKNKESLDIIKKIKEFKEVRELNKICGLETSKVVLEFLIKKEVFIKNLREEEINNLIIIKYSEYCNKEKVIEHFNNINRTFNKEKIETYIDLKNSISSSKLNFFKKQALKSLDFYLIYNDKDKLLSAKYWHEKGQYYSFIIIFILTTIFLGVIFFMIYRNKIKRKKVSIKNK